MVHKTLFHMIQQGNKSLITPPCLLITVTFRHKETLQGVNNITTVTLLQVRVRVNQFHHYKNTFVA